MLLDRIAHSFPAHSGVLHAAVRHLVHAEAGDISDDKGPDFQFVESCLDEPDIAGEETGL